ncbi:MAG: hypothetical protein A2589_00435 [Candidatus Vogelbacteria bacterium RIFOXYD1_FULL_46_19]|uniref:Uncharacterized protein n=1 Tax=Candidatus Vogelbacteria bacterium RIFOXYD1_FULL_46_19 TaxID=1802439 RepID=A0A1G2QIE3_9BACT|nr:MAG: hypothetical protein A2589_00435 [Candidatus Vogelbacteria bacterium RIFOXYD1_FULL_46_19]
MNRFSLKTTITLAAIGLILVIFVFMIGLPRLKAQGGFTTPNGVTSTHSMGGFNFSSTREINNSGGNDPRAEANVEASKEEAQKLEQQQKEDLKKCLEESGIGGMGAASPAGQAMNQALNQATSDVLQDNLPAELQEEIATRLPAELNTQVREHLPEELGNLVRADLQDRLPEAINAATNGGIEPLLREDLSQIMSDLMTSSIQDNFGQAMTGSIEAGLPDALQNSVRSGLPAAMQEILTTQLPGALAEQLPQIMEAELGALIQDGLIDELSGEAGVTSDMIDRLTDEMLNEFTGTALDGLNASIDQITNGVLDSVTGNLDSILDQSLGSLDDVINQTMGQFTGVIDQQLSGILDDLTGEFDSMLDGVLDGVLGEFDSVIDQTFGELTGVFDDVIGDTIGQFTGVFDDALSGITDGLISPITDQLSGLMDGIMSPVTGMLDSITDSVLSPITDMTSNLIGNITSPITDAFGGVLGGITDSFSGALDGFASNVLGATGITGAVGNVVQGAVGNVAGGLLGNVPILGGLNLPIPGLGVYVPVQEVEGKLMRTTVSIDNYAGEIDKTTKKIEELTVEMCTYLKSIQRIQTAFEQKEFIEDVDLRRQANEESEQYRTELIDYTKKGYDSTGQGPDAPLYVENLRTHLDELVIPEATNVFLDDLDKSEDSFKVVSKSLILKELPIKPDTSTVSLEDYQRFVTGEVTDSEEWTKLYQNIRNPFIPNSPETSYKINQRILVQRQADAENDAINQIVAAQGYLPVRECEEFTEDGQACRRWKTITPAIQVKETAADILNYRLDLYKEAEPGDVSPGGGPTLEEVRTHTPSDQGGGGSGPGSFDIGQILNLLGSLFGGGGSGESDNPVTEPSFDYSLLPLSQVNAGQPNTAQLAWSIPGATNCRATNNWFSGNSTDAPTLIYAKGSVVPSESERTISLPLNFKPRFIRTRNNVDNSIEIATSVNSSKTSTLNKLPLPADIQIGDKYTVSFWPYVGSTNLVEFTVTENLTQSQLGQKLLEKINLARNSSTNPAYPVFSSYYFALNGLAIDASLSPNYSLECTSPGGNITKSITLAR